MKFTFVRSLGHASKVALCVGVIAAFNGCVDDGSQPYPIRHPGRVYYGDAGYGYGYGYGGPGPYHRPLPRGPSGPVGPGGGPGGPAISGGPGGSGLGPGPKARRGPRKPAPKPGGPGQQNPPPPR